MKIGRGVSSFTSYRRIKKITSVQIDGIQKIGQETIIKKKGIPYLLGVIKNFLLFEKNQDKFCIQKDYSLIRKRIVIQNPIKNSDGLSQEIAGQFRMPNGMDVLYHSAQKGHTKVLIENLKNKPNIYVSFLADKQGADPSQVNYFMSFFSKMSEQAKKKLVSFSLP